MEKQFFKPGSENENLPSVVNVTYSDSGLPAIKLADPLPKSGEGSKVLWDEAGAMPVSSEFTHYLEFVSRPYSTEKFSADVEKISKHFNADIYDTCNTCGKLTKNNICKECSNDKIE